VQECCEARWEAALRTVEGHGEEFRRQGFADQAACCADMTRQMTSGLRGVVVRRTLRSSASGLEAMAGCGDAMRLLAGEDPLSTLPLISRLRTDAQRRVNALAETVEREAKEAEFWSVRGRLPEGEPPPALAAEESTDLWADVSEAEALAGLLARLGPRKGQSSEPADAVVAALARLDALTAFVSETIESVKDFARTLGSDGGLTSEACQGAVIALEASTKELAAFNEDLLEILDADDAEAARALAASWDSRWCASALTGSAAALAETGPQLACAPRALDGRRPMFLALRGLLVICSEADSRAQAVKVLV